MKRLPCPHGAARARDCKLCRRNKVMRSYYRRWAAIGRLVKRNRKGGAQ